MSIFKVIAIVVISGVVLLTVLIIYSISPTINDVSDEAPLKSYLNKLLTLKQTSYLLKVEQGQYDFLEHILVIDSTYPGTKVAEFSIGKTIIINQFKTYTNNLGSGFTHLYAVGEITITKGNKINFQYNLGNVDKGLYSDVTYKLNYTVWQDSTDLQIDLTKK